MREERKRFKDILREKESIRLRGKGEGKLGIVNLFIYNLEILKKSFLTFTFLASKSQPYNDK